MGRVHVSNVRELPGGTCRTAPPLAMRCRLAEIAPSVLLDPHSHWSPAATHFFQTITKKGSLIAKVNFVEGFLAT